MKQEVCSQATGLRKLFFPRRANRFALYILFSITCLYHSMSRRFFNLFRQESFIFSVSVILLVNIRIYFETRASDQGHRRWNSSCGAEGRWAGWQDVGGMGNGGWILLSRTGRTPHNSSSGVCAVPLCLENPDAAEQSCRIL